MKPRSPGRLQAAGLVGASLLGYAGSFLVSKAIAVQFGPSGLGIAGALLGVAAIVASLAVAGQLNNLALWVSTRPEQRGRLSALSGLAALTVGVPVAVVTCLVVGLWANPIDSWLVLVLGGAALVTGQTLSIQRPALLAALKSPSSVSRFTSIYALVSMAVSVVLVLLWPQKWLMLSLGLGALAGGVVGVLATRMSDSGKTGMPGLSEVLAFIRSGSRGMPGVVINALAMGGLPVLVVLLVGKYEAGLFRATWSVAAAIWALSMTIQKNVYFPNACRAADSSDFELLNAGPSRSVLVGSAIAASVVAVASPCVLHVLFSAQFVPASTALSILSVGAFFRVWIGANSYFVFARGRQGLYSFLEAYSVLLSIVGVVVGSLFDSVAAIAVGLSSCLLVAAVTAEIIARRLDRDLVPSSGASGRDLLMVTVLMLLSLATIALR